MNHSFQAGTALNENGRLAGRVPLCIVNGAAHKPRGQLCFQKNRTKQQDWYEKRRPPIELRPGSSSEGRRSD